MAEQEKKYESVQLVLGESNPQVCSAVKMALFQQGMRGVISCSKAESLSEALDDTFADLLIFDYDLPGGEFAEIMQKIRRRLVGKNPFVSVIATVSNVSAPLVKSVINAGVDDVIGKPLSVSRLLNRLPILLKRRKKFIVSHNYVGPSRRTKERPDDPPARIMDAPNTLKSRVIDLLGSEEVAQLVEAESSKLEDFQLDTSAGEIERIVGRITAGYTGEGAESDWRGDLNRLVVVAETMRERHSSGETQGIADMARLLAALARRLLSNSMAQGIVETDLLLHMSQALRRGLSVERHAVDTMEQISQIVGRFTGGAVG